MKRLHFTILLCVLILLAGISVPKGQALAASAAEINRNVQIALLKLYEKSPPAREMGQKAKAILVFPDIVKGGFIVGGQYGEGALIKDGKVVGFYSTVSASYGLQAGIQKYGYALFLMSDSALRFLDRSEGWELGLTPNVVVVDVGAAGGISTTTAKSDIYAFFFDQKGLMAGLGLQGTKITRIVR
ncbi:MAG: hypothetical protein A4E72_00746 [Syntrophus sp. PtaU1.Bin208]|nr:MAG: hypothetical protein A4E72_00746 [Syntrophus sp. PtaU1.Bin208]